MTADRLGERLGTGADGNPIHVGDQIQTRLNTSELATSDQRRVLNRDVWTVVGRRDDGTVTAVHAGSRDATVQLTADYLGKHTVLAYATTIAGAQGRTVDAGHTVVTPRTDSASLYVGMTRGRLRNHAHVVTDGHDHDELQLGHRSGLQRVRRRRRPQPGRRDLRDDRPPTLGRGPARTGGDPTPRPRTREGVEVVARHQPAPARTGPRRHWPSGPTRWSRSSPDCRPARGRRPPPKRSDRPTGAHPTQRTTSPPS